MALKVDSSNDEEHERSGNDWYNRTRNRPTRVAAAAARRVVGVLVVDVVVAKLVGLVNRSGLILKQFLRVQILEQMSKKF